jgi:hypothetical protein
MKVVEIIRNNYLQQLEVHRRFRSVLTEAAEGTIDAILHSL